MKRGTMFPFREWKWDGYTALTTRHGSAGSTCGSAALAMIVNVSPHALEIQSGCNARKPFDIPTARRMLKRYGFESHHFEGPQGLVNLGWNVNWAADHLESRHLLLFTADTTKQDASWFVAFDGEVYHNGHFFSSSVLFGLTNPAIDILLVRRKKK